MSGGDTIHVSFTVKNVGDRAGLDVAQVYAAPMAIPGVEPGSVGPASSRLIGWEKLALKPGESQTVSISADPRTVAIFDATTHRWDIAGLYFVSVGGSSHDRSLKSEARLAPRAIAP